MRHIDIRDLWLQKEVSDGKLSVIKVAGDMNPADLMTKVLSQKEIEWRLRMLNIEVRGSWMVERESMAEIGGMERWEVKCLGSVEKDIGGGFWQRR